MSETPLPHIAVLMAAYNRRALTLRALHSLEAARDVFDISVVLFDDASTDGTADAVRAAWPDAIVLTGDGDAFWNGGMFQAWTHARTLQPDGYLWLNDDVELDADALPRLAAEWHMQGGAAASFILVGATRGHDGRLTYGAQNRVPSPTALKFARLGVGTAVQCADTFNGNIVLVSRATVEKIGINDPHFFHTLGDIDYGLRATRARIPVLMLPGTLGLCETNPPVRLDQGSWSERWRRVQSHRGLPLRNWWRITRRYSGLWFPLHFLLPYRKLLRDG